MRIHLIPLPVFRIILGMLLFCFTPCFGQLSLKIIREELIYDTPPFNSCHAPTIVEVVPGKFIIASFGGTHEGNKDVGIWLSESNNSGWSKPIEMANGIINDTVRYPSLNPVLFKTREEKLF